MGSAEGQQTTAGIEQWGGTPWLALHLPHVELLRVDGSAGGIPQAVACHLAIRVTHPQGVGKLIC
jgi:hypothetical protein